MSWNRRRFVTGALAIGTGVACGGRSSAGSGRADAETEGTRADAGDTSSTGTPASAEAGARDQAAGERPMADVAGEADAVAAKDGARDTASAAVDDVIDTHLHIKDAQAVSDYGKAKAAAITGCVMVEANWTLDQNQTFLDLADKNSVFVAVVGNLPGIGTDAFKTYVDRFAPNKLFRGIRGARASLSDAALASFKYLASKGLSLDIYQVGGAGVFPMIARFAQMLPDLTIVFDHTCDLDQQLGSYNGALPAAWVSGVREIAKQPNVFVKTSADLSKPISADAYRKAYDELFSSFGEDRIFFASNWPVWDVAQNYTFAAQYIAGKPKTVQEKFWWRNSQAAYRWTRR